MTDEQNRPLGHPVDWPAGTDPELIAEFEDAQRRIEGHLEELKTGLDAEIAAAAAAAARYRRRTKIYLAFCFTGFAVCLLSVFTIESMYWAGYALIVTGVLYQWWDAPWARRLRRRLR